MNNGNRNFEKFERNGGNWLKTRRDFKDRFL